MSAPQESLSGLRVLDLSRVLAGPWATQLLGDLGAEVIKIERPGGGDDTRAWAPPFLRDAQGEPTAESAYFLCANRNKKSVTADFSTPEGAELVRALALASDVVVENFKLGGLAAYGLDYETLSARNPRLIYCSISGFGRTGPAASLPGYDLLIQAMGGLMNITGRPDGEPGGGPQKVGVAVVDLMTGLYATAGILAALINRDKTGVGQRVEVALFDTQIAMLANQAMNYLVTGASPRRMGNTHPSIAPYEDLATSDGAMIVAIGNDRQFAALCSVFGCPQWATDPRFATNPERVRNRAALIDGLTHIARSRTTAHWVEALRAAGVPCGPVNTVAEALEDPQTQARGLRLALPHASAGQAPSIRAPIELSSSPLSYRRGPPILGEDTDEVLSSLLGLTEQRIQELRKKGVV